MQRHAAARVRAEALLTSAASERRVLMMARRPPGLQKGKGRGAQRRLWMAVASNSATPRASAAS